MTHLLDRPAWQALAGRHAPLALGDHLARRYRPVSVPFMSTMDDSPAALASLGTLLGEGERGIILQVPDIVLPDTLTVLGAFPGVQMISDRHFPRRADPRIQPLGPDDAADMLALAEMTRPGPFTLGAQLLGQFWGIRLDGVLIAMAGERMKVPGRTELSGVCTHPEHQGKGLGRLMSEFVAGEICARGEQPFLHAYATNDRAIALYKSIGFSLRTMMQGALIALAGTEASGPAAH